MVRKRTSEQNASVEPRQTRQTSRRGRLLESSSDSDIENKAEDSKAKINFGELRNADSYPTRARAKRDGNSTIQDSINLTNGNEAAVAAALLSGSKKQTRKKRVLTAADNTLVEDPSPLKNLGKSTRSQAKFVAVLDLPGPETEKGQSTTLVDMKNAKTSSDPTMKRISETPRKVSPKRQSNSLIKLGANIVTPESSPMLVHLSPRRSSKTPKKSPMNIGSPKTHSKSPLRLSKTPRKLTVVAESPATSDKSTISTSNNSPTEVESSGMNGLDPFVVLTDFTKAGSPTTEKTLNTTNSSEISPKYLSVAKIRLRKSGEKSPSHSASDSSKLSHKKSDLSASQLTVKRSPIKKPRVLGSKVLKSPVKTPSPNPKVTSTFAKSSKRLSVLGTPSRTPRRTLTNVKQMNISDTDNPKLVKSAMKKRVPVSSLGTPLRPTPHREEAPSTKKALLSREFAPEKPKIVLDLANCSPEASPEGRVRRSSHLSPDLIKFSSASTSSPIERPRRTSRTASSQKMIEDVSIELFNCSNPMDENDDVFAISVAPADGTYDLSEVGKSEETLEQTKIRDNTYDLEEPKTPSLRKKSRKRSFSNVELDQSMPEARKRCRVRFASPAQDGSRDSPATLESVKKSLPTVNTPNKRRAGKSAAPSSSRRRSRSLTKIDQNTPSTRTAIKRRSVSASDSTNKTPKLSRSTQESVTRLSRPRHSTSSETKSESKLPAVRKAPNFAQIHQKKFAEMESLVDAKKRVAKRHEELTALPTMQSSPALVPESTTAHETSGMESGSYNRFGFRLRKTEAIKVVSKAPPTGSKIKNRQEMNRTILKGVRLNKRFELQMKMRNMKQ